MILQRDIPQSGQNKLYGSRELKSKIDKNREIRSEKMKLIWMKIFPLKVFEVFMAVPTTITVCARCQASAEVKLRLSLFWDITTPCNIPEDRRPKDHCPLGRDTTLHVKITIVWEESASSMLYQAIRLQIPEDRNIHIHRIHVLCRSNED
jgi:hypothetical protein